MSLAGQSAVAIWHDIAPEARQEFYAWHGEEHMPERLGIPGFLRGRRYVAIEADLEYFNLYEVESHVAVTGPDYLQRLNNPTPWTKATVKHFRNVARSLCRVAASFGRGQGGLIATWRYDVPDSRADAHRKALVEVLLPRVACERGMAGLHLLIADAEASAVDTAEKKERTGQTAIPRWVLLAEGWGDEEDFAALCRKALSNEVLAQSGAGAASFGLYRLQTTRGKTDQGAP